MKIALQHSMTYRFVFVWMYLHYGIINLLVLKISKVLLIPFHAVTRNSCKICCQVFMRLRLFSPIDYCIFVASSIIWLTGSADMPTQHNITFPLQKIKLWVSVEAVGSGPERDQNLEFIGGLPELFLPCGGSPSLFLTYVGFRHCSLSVLDPHHCFLPV